LKGGGDTGVDFQKEHKECAEGEGERRGKREDGGGSQKKQEKPGKKGVEG